METIAAIATPIGQGGIAVVRVSGPDAIPIADKVFCGRKPLAECASHTVHFGHFVLPEGAVADEVVATIFRGPKSYTGEDTVEFSCHGGQYVASKVLDGLLSSGVRMAEPGEFTKRAFLNGRMDLAQAEAVADLINALSERAHRASIAQLQGWLSGEINGIRDQLVNILGLLELELDFAEEGIELLDRNKVITLTQEALDEVTRLLESYSSGKIYREGVNVVLAGLPNVGKSSLLNTLLNEERAIVTPIPGTTRDVIEESITIGGVLFRLADTAGIRQTSDIVEQEGVNRTNRRIREADIVIVLFDGEKGIQREEEGFLQELQDLNKKMIPVINKIDLVKDVKTCNILSRLFPRKPLEISALKRIGIEGLKQEMLRLALAGSNGSSHDGAFVVSNIRHAKALERAKESLSASLESLKAHRGGDLVAVDMRAALDSLGEIIGVVTTEDILNNIFSKFCIGK